MGGWASALQGIGGIGEDVATGKQLASNQRQQDVMNRLNMFAASAKLQQLQQALKDTPENKVATLEKVLGRQLTDTEKASLFGFTPKTQKFTYQTVIGPDGKPHRYQIDEETNARTDLGESYEKPDAAKEPKISYQTMLGPDGKPHRYQIDESTNKKTDMGLVYERPVQAKGGNKPLTAAQISSQYNQIVNTFKTQLSQATTSMNQANSQKTAHPIYSKLGLIGTDSTAAKETRDRAQKAISYLMQHRERVVSGKEDIQDVSDAAQAIMDGSDSAGAGNSIGSATMPKISHPSPGVTVIE